MPAPAVHTPTGVVTPIPSPPLKAAKGTTPKGDFSQLAKAAKVIPAHKAKSQQKVKATDNRNFDPNTAKVSKRNEDSNTYLNADGTHTVVVSRGPINVRDGKGGSRRPRPRGATLRPGGWYVPDNPLSPQFGDDATPRTFFCVPRWLQNWFTLQGASHSGVEHVTVPFTSIGANQMLYRNVFKNVDLVYQVDTSEVKESLVLIKGALEEGLDIALDDRRSRVERCTKTQMVIWNSQTCSGIPTFCFPLRRSGIHPE